MKKMFCLLLVFWLSLLISHCAGPIEQPTGSVEGVVRDSDRQPIEGARVVVDTTNLQAITDSRGYYQLTSVPAGQRTLIASKSGYVSETKVVNIRAGHTVTEDFTLQTQGAQQVVWQKTFGGSDDDRARSVQET
ncbi:carboxypeptidase-like regulatory domain-containing protein, partial [Pseudothermotoga sp.]